MRLPLWPMDYLERCSLISKFLEYFVIFLLFLVSHVVWVHALCDFKMFIFVEVCFMIHKQVSYKQRSWMFHGYLKKICILLLLDGMFYKFQSLLVIGVIQIFCIFTDFVPSVPCSLLNKECQDPQLELWNCLFLFCLPFALCVWMFSCLLHIHLRCCIFLVYWPFIM